MTQLRYYQNVDLAPQFLDDNDKPAPVEDIQWGTDNSDLVTLTPSADGKTCNVRAVGPLGNCRVTMKCDAKIGDGVKELIGWVDFEIAPGEATRVVMNVGEPQNNTPPSA